MMRVVWLVIGVSTILQLRIADSEITQLYQLRSMLFQCQKDMVGPLPKAVAGTCKSNPCILRSSQTQRMAIQFTPTKSCTKVVTKAWFKMFNMNFEYLPLLLPQSNACVDFKATMPCPLKQGTQYTIWKDGPIWFLPATNYTVRIALVCEDDSRKPQEVIFCFQFPFQIQFGPFTG